MNKNGICHMCHHELHDESVESICFSLIEPKIESEFGIFSH